MRSTDVLVAGAGPAGLATAMYAARRGLSVVVAEPRRFPVDKACGEGLMPSAVAHLEELGIQVHGRPFRGIAYVQGEDRVEADFEAGAGRGVRRTWLQGAMQLRARQLGVRFIEASVDHIDERPDEVIAAGIRARYLIGADGLHSKVRRLAGITATSPGGPRFGLRRHFEVEPWSDVVEVHWSDQCEAYVTPVGDQLVGIAVLSTSRLGFDAHLGAFPALAERVVHAQAGSTRGAGPLRQDVARRTSGRVALVGDAAGYVDALTGEGIAMSLVCARALAECLADDDLGGYERSWRSSTRSYRLLTRGLLRARSTAFVGPRIVPLAQRLPRVFSGAVRQLA